MHTSIVNFAEKVKTIAKVQVDKYVDSASLPKSRSDAVQAAFAYLVKIAVTICVFLLHLVETAKNSRFFVKVADNQTCSKVFLKAKELFEKAVATVAPKAEKLDNQYLGGFFRTVKDDSLAAFRSQENKEEPTAQQ